MITCSIKATPLFDWPLPLAPAAPPDLPGFAVLAAGDVPEDVEAFEDFASLDALVEAVVAAVDAGFGDVAAAASARRCLSRSPLPVPEEEVSKALV
ncbi:hypothetical protein [Burkholderia gladioli]|uniref:hypothetical protein n=1 Tax=Burkholderia gladioli TaxID=28095 RepID=UPI00163EFE58|nr:hypothetical protein [Burkholderia gladioli]